MASGYYRFPTIHQEIVAFVCEDDLWTVPAGGGLARRLTSNLGEVSRPLYSPDGSWLAYTGREEGHPEVYLMPALGGSARRLTFMGGSETEVVGWTEMDQVVFTSNAGQPFRQLFNLYLANTQGHPPQSLNFGPARAITYQPSGPGVVIGRNTGDPARWKRYRGGTAGQLWIDRQGEGQFQPLIDLEGNLAAPMWVGERIYFISDHEGVGNLYSCTEEGANLERHTDHVEFYARNATSDGHRIVYHCGADVYLLEPGTEESRRIDISFHSPQTQRNRRFVPAWDYLESWKLHPKGHALAVTARGKPFTFSLWEGAVRQHGELNGARYRLAEWLNDDRHLLAVTDEGGEESLVLFDTEETDPPLLLPDMGLGRIETLAVNPRSDKIAFSNHRYELQVLDLDNGELTLIDKGAAGPIAGFDWSPDGTWLVYSVSLSLQISALRLWHAPSGEITPLTRPFLRDTQPAFDRLGKHIYFLSKRRFEPVYDNIQFDLNFPRGEIPCLVTLQKDLPSPFIPIPHPPGGSPEAIASGSEGSLESEPEQDPDEAVPGDEEPEDHARFSQTGGEPGAPGAGQPDSPAAAGDAAGTPEKPPLQIDLEGIEERVIAFPTEEGLYGRIAATQDGKVLYSLYPSERSSSRSGSSRTGASNGVLVMYDFEKQEETTLLQGMSDFDLNRHGTVLIYRSGNWLRVLKAGEKPDKSAGSRPNRRSGWLDLDRIKISIDPGLEWRQMFREAWRLQRDQFWTPDMSEVDWVAVHNRYLPLIDRVASRAEFSDLLWEMQGELGTSHCYELGGDYRPQPHYRQGDLGADFSFDEDAGVWRIRFIARGDPWDEGANSPLHQPGFNLEEGDRLLAINGRPMNKTASPQSQLVNLANAEVELTIASGEDGPPRTLITKTLADPFPPRYRHWVERNRELVHRETDGMAGYVHIPDMQASGFAEFHRGYLAELDRSGLIVDVRFNTGGHVSALILEKLARRRIGYDLFRWSEKPAPYPPESIQGPLVALTNEYAGSDGDIFSHGFKVLSLGPLVGTRTWGGVVGIWPRHSLVDGTVTTQPEISFYFEDIGWAVENYGTEPDIEVDIKPQEYAQGADPQLARAIEEIKKALREHPPEVPDFSQRPSRALPKLPGRGQMSSPGHSVDEPSGSL